jgi:hypothetical protein
MSNIEIYYDHYKDTFSYLREYIKLRDKQFIYVVFLFGLLFFNTFSPIEFKEVTKILIEKQTGIMQNSFSLLDSVLLFLVLSFSIKYFQSNILIQKQYKYLHKLEEDLSKNFENFEISRESKGYLNDYPIFSSIVHRIYTMVFPSLIILLSIIKWMNIVNNQSIDSYFWFNTMTIISIIGLTTFYLYWINFKRKKK